MQHCCSKQAFVVQHKAIGEHPTEPLLTAQREENSCFRSTTRKKSLCASIYDVWRGGGQEILYPQICGQTIQILPAKREMGWENPKIFVDVTYGRSPFFFSPLSPLSVFLILVYATKIRDCARHLTFRILIRSAYYIGLDQFPELELPGIDSLLIEKNLNTQKRHLVDSDCCMNVYQV